MGLFSSIGKIAKSVVSGISGGDLLSAGASILGGTMTNSANASASKKSNDLSLYMSNTAHQREVADLKAAGLNPILSVNNGASTPQVSTPQVNDTIGNATTSALQGKLLRANIQNVNADTAKKISEQQTTDTQGALNTMMFQNAKRNGLLLDAQLPEAIANASIYSGDHAGLIKTIEKSVPFAGDVINGAKSLKGLVGLSKANPGFKLPLKGK